MAISRRNFLGMFGVAAGAAAASTALPTIALARPEPARIADVPQRAKRVAANILLNSNENAYGQLPSVQAAMREALAAGNRYPFRTYDAFLDQVAEYNHVRPEQVVLGNGSSEILYMAAAAFTGPDRKLVAAHPTFESLGSYAKARGAQVVQVPLAADYSHDLEAMRGRIDSSTGLVYICNPNNPTATLTPRNKIEDFMKSLPPNVMVLLDEAYHHFAVGADGYTSFLEKPINDDRLIIARTFSKVYGMAGLRMGYGVATPKVISQLKAYSAFDNANIVALQAGVASLKDDAAMHTAVTRNATDRAEFLKQATARGIKYIPSYTNFIMIETGKPVKQVIANFQQRGIAIGRPFPPMDTYARISFGTPDQMTAYWKAWDEMAKA